MATQLVLTNAIGSVVGHPLPIGEMSYSLARHDVGVLECSVDKKWGASLDYEYRVEVYRRLPPLPPVLIRSYFVETVEETTDEKEREVLRITGYDPNVLLSWRDIEAFANSTGAAKTDHGDDLMRAFVREQMGASAADPIDSNYFSVEADTHQGPSITVAKAWDNLLQALREISDETAGQGNRVYFQIVDYGKSGAYMFRAKTGCLGSDHSAGSDSPLLVGLGFGNVSSLVMTADASREVNHVLATGRGQEEARLVGESVGQGASRNVWSRKKLIYNANDLGTVAALNSSAAGRVKQGGTLERVVATLAEAPGFHFGYDWAFGDKLSVAVHGEYWTGMVNAVRWRISERGHETIDAKLEVTRA